MVIIRQCAKSNLRALMFVLMGSEFAKFARFDLIVGFIIELRPFYFNHGWNS